MKHLDEENPSKKSIPVAEVPLKENQPENEELKAEAMLEALFTDPVGFVQSIVDSSAQTHLADLKDEAELNGALRAARRAHPEFARFESFILQEVVELLKTDSDGIIDPWQDLLEKGFNKFQEKFKETVKNNPELLENAVGSQPIDSSNAFIEGSSARVGADPLPSFTREQIAKMSSDEFLANEEAIEKALKLKRIR